MGIHISKNSVTIDDSKYPKLLKKINDSPKQLYCKGEWHESIFENCLAVVGSRRMTSYGKQITAKLVSQIASAGITIVSGFMFGIDATAHRAAIDAGGRTIAVMPCGIDLISPEYQEELYKDILENQGLIISEYKDKFLPTLWTYPRRNRIVAGLSKAALIIEAGDKSGSLITASLAKKFKRKIFVVPGPLTSSLSVGIGQLIKQGADVITCAEDVLEYYGKRNVILNAVKDPVEDPRDSSPTAQNDIEQKIIQELQRESMEIDLLARALNMSAAEIGTIVSLMQIKGLVFIENNKYYVNI